MTRKQAKEQGRQATQYSESMTAVHTSGKGNKRAASWATKEPRGPRGEACNVVEWTPASGGHITRKRAVTATTTLGECIV